MNNKNCEKVKFLKNQSESNRRKRIQRWMNELREILMVDDQSPTTESTCPTKLDKIDLLECAIKQLRYFNNSFQMGYENCRNEIVTCLKNYDQNYENIESSSARLLLDKLRTVNTTNGNVLRDSNYNDDNVWGAKRDVLVKLRQKIIENKRKKCIKQKMNMVMDGANGDDVWRPW